MVGPAVPCGSQGEEPKAGGIRGSPGRTREGVFPPGFFLLTFLRREGPLGSLSLLSALLNDWSLFLLAMGTSPLVPLLMLLLQHHMHDI